MSELSLEAENEHLKFGVHSSIRFEALSMDDNPVTSLSQWRHVYAADHTQNDRQNGITLFVKLIALYLAGFRKNFRTVWYCFKNRASESGAPLAPFLSRRPEAVHLFCFPVELYATDCVTDSSSLPLTTILHLLLFLPDICITLVSLSHLFACCISLTSVGVHPLGLCIEVHVGFKRP